jgi:hypothetical protein
MGEEEEEGRSCKIDGGIEDWIMDSEGVLVCDFDSWVASPL